MMPDWLQVTHGTAPLVVSLPHTGIDIPTDLVSSYVSPWMARRDADWWVDRLYDFAAGLGASVVRSKISRSVIDVNRDPSGVSLYPGQTTTELCPTSNFDGDALYFSGREPNEAEIARRRHLYFQPYHDALAREIARLREHHARVVVYDAHSIRSVVPRLFSGVLPQFNIGTASGQSCDATLTAAVEAVCTKSGFSQVSNGRFRGGWITRHYGNVTNGAHAIQIELACRGYMGDPDTLPTPETWPPPFSPAAAAPMRVVLHEILTACLHFAVS